MNTFQGYLLSIDNRHDFHVGYSILPVGPKNYSVSSRIVNLYNPCSQNPRKSGLSAILVSLKVTVETRVSRGRFLEMTRNVEV